VCTGNATPHFLTKIFGGGEAAALAACKNARGRSTASGVHAQQVSVNGKTATATVPYPGRTIRLALAKQGGHWKLTEATNLGEEPRRAAREIASCLKARGLTIEAQNQMRFGSRAVPAVFTKLPSGKGMGILVYAFGHAKDFSADLNGLLKDPSKPKVSILKTKRGPRLILFEKAASAADQRLAESCLPDAQSFGG
jgi:hypothetical protein